MSTAPLAINKKNSLTLRNQKCYAVKVNHIYFLCLKIQQPGIAVNLDVARKTYEELLTDLQEGSKLFLCLHFTIYCLDITNELEEYLPNENTRMAYSITRGFHYVWVCNNAATASLPSVLFVFKSYPICRFFKMM